VIVAGPEENGHRQEVERAVREAALQEVFQFVGPVAGEAKAALYRESDLFILPTFSENFGIFVAEALSYGVPVITTRGAPWEGLITHGCGWWVEVGVQPLLEAMREATALSETERQTMGLRGRHFVERAFSWHESAGEMLAVYRWILGFGEKPDCLVLD
jgi:glycosyltransferase involved in cell wall biosynthesis